MEPNVEKIAQVIGEVKKVIVGKDESIYKVMMAILAGGHVLLEDVPGVGKTRMALSFSKAMMLKANRIQFTPDVLPADITGFSMYQKHTGNFVYQPGAAMCNLLLADEINRTSPKTQSALLEVMEEGHVTVDGITRPVPQPFIVLATQNPVGFSGTQQLPESQVDRFMISLSIGYPKPEDELRLMKDRHTRDPLDLVEAVMTQEELLYLRKQVENVFIHDIVYEYIIRLANATRNHPMLELGVSPRGALDLMRLAKAAAFLRNRDFALPQDVADVAADAMTHRLRLNTRSRIGHHTTSEVMGLILEQIKMPAPEGVQ
ncbi:MAG: MoxR family ATPase [Lachnospiraceae bacterium]|nr:MoxR family ATPase [Lachnospiraceae bacterium]